MAVKPGGVGPMFPHFQDIFKIRACVSTFPFNFMVRVGGQGNSDLKEIWEHKHAPYVALA